MSSLYQAAHFWNSERTSIRAQGDFSSGSGTEIPAGSLGRFSNFFTRILHSIEFYGYIRLGYLNILVQGYNNPIRQHGKHENILSIDEVKFKGFKGFDRDSRISMPRIILKIKF